MHQLIFWHRIYYGVKALLSIAVFILYAANTKAQLAIDLSKFQSAETSVSVDKELLTVSWPAGNNQSGKIILDFASANPLFNSIQIGKGKGLKEIASHLDPAFILTVGKRTLSPNSGGWDVFFDRVPRSPYQAYNVDFTKRNASVRTEGAHTIVRIGEVKAATFHGALEITIYNGSPFFNIAAVMSTQLDSTAILYDAGLISKKSIWQNITWSDVANKLNAVKPSAGDTSRNLEVKYRTIIAENASGSLAVFPAPHQYFYPLDEAFNLKFTWYGRNYHNLIPGFGIGIRQDPLGDGRFVPWFNAPPGTEQRLNFFCLLSTEKAAGALAYLKKFTHDDSYAALPGYKTMATHFHNEFTTNVPLAGLPMPKQPEFVEVSKRLGLNIVKLAEFHSVGHPKGPDSTRLKELHALFYMNKRYSDKNFLLLPGEEANNFYGGHWLAFFSKPIYWIMSRQPQDPFKSVDPKYGTVYRVSNKEEMLKLLEEEKGLAWTAHARTKSSTGYPDRYKEESFFRSETFLGAAWKAIPGDLSIPTLSKRVLNLMDDMANWGLKKYVIAESDIFTMTHQNEMYAHVNVNYLQMNKLPSYSEGWQAVLDVMRHGKFFVSTGEVLIPSFAVNGKGSGETLQLDKTGQASIRMQLQWTFPMNFVEIVSGDGSRVYRERINLNNTQEFGKRSFNWPVNLAGKKWVRVEAWDIAANGAFTQIVWIK